MTITRHPWLTQFESTPEKAFGDLISGYASVHPYERADAPDAARMLFGALKPEDSALATLGSAILGWLEQRRKEPLPSARSKLQRRLREICEVFEIVALLEIKNAAVDLRRRRLVWSDWVSRLVLSPARDARAEYWRMLALTQGLVAASEPDVVANGLAPVWQDICREAGGRLPRYYLPIGLLGLRRLPQIDDPTQLPWVSGLAQWALARNPSDREFKEEWLAVKPLYPRAPQTWRRLIAKLLSAPTFKEEIETPAWWHVDPDFAPMTKAVFRISQAPLRSPLPVECEKIIEKLNQPFEDVEPLVDDLFERHRRYLYATGDAQYFVRATHALGRELVERGGHARAQRAQALVREGLRWEPHNRYLWALWRDALVADGLPLSAELIGWESIRRDPADVDKRNQLAILLVNSLGKVEEAESLLKETVEKFPNDVVAHTELAELLIFLDRSPEAAFVLDMAMNLENRDETIYAMRARVYSAQGSIRDAERIIQEGLALKPLDVVLQQYWELLKQGQKLPLKTHTYRITVHRELAQKATAGTVDTELIYSTRFGTMRQLRSQLESSNRNKQEKALEKLQETLREDPTFSYAELLAARHGIWHSNINFIPPFAAAFEVALAQEDRDKLEELAALQPRLQALILVAQALFGDVDAQRKVARWLEESEPVIDEPAIAGLHSALRTVLDNDRPLKDVFVRDREMVIHALYDANEAALSENSLAA